MEKEYHFSIDLSVALDALCRVFDTRLRRSSGLLALEAAANDVCRRLCCFGAKVHFSRRHSSHLMHLSLWLPLYPSDWWWIGTDFAAATVAIAAKRIDIADEICSMIFSAVASPQSVGEVN